ncbi:hypothetical protein [Streptomyces sp. WM6378]|uniref:Vgb family protein n=1 Tax=Streptomyces sp. WM6378 TaxID=1415557 RepID=UPI0006AFB8C9|nr:hypothetical protein [Streptomyces sp. WM6378]
MHPAVRALACLALALPLMLTGCTDAHRPAAPEHSATATVVSRSPQAVELPGNSWPAELAMAPDGTLWAAESSIGFLASISPDGRIIQHRLADAIHSPSLDPTYLAVASDGSVWFTCPNYVGRLAPDGKVSLFGPPVMGPGSPDAITAGADGSVWYGSASVDASQLTHLTASLSATRIPVPLAPFAPHVTSLAFGPGGRLWFTESPISKAPSEVGYADSSRHTEVWRLPLAATPIGSIVPGPDGALWFSETNAIGRITPSGAISSYRTGNMTYVRSVIAGPDHAMWFTTSTEVGRITMAGVISLWPLPGAQDLADLVYEPRHHGFLIADAKAAALRWFPMPA